MTPNGAFDQKSSSSSHLLQTSHDLRGIPADTNGLFHNFLGSFCSYHFQKIFWTGNFRHSPLPAWATKLPSFTGFLVSPSLFLSLLQSVLSSHPWLGMYSMYSAPCLPHLGLWTLHSSIHSLLCLITPKFIPKGTRRDIYTPSIPVTSASALPPASLLSGPLWLPCISPNLSGILRPTLGPLPSVS